MVHDHQFMSVDKKVFFLFKLADLIKQRQDTVTLIIRMTILWWWINKGNFHIPSVQNNVK